MNTQDTLTLVQSLAERMLARGAMMATAESCTGGLIAAACTELAGSSAWFDRGFVTYSNQAKTELLWVDAELITQHGAVSEPVARAMAQGALVRAKVDYGVAVTGVAGPSGGSPDKPVGTVWLAWAARDGRLLSRVCLFEGDRAHIRQQTCVEALQGLIRLAQA